MSVGRAPGAVGAVSESCFLAQVEAGEQAEMEVAAVELRRSLEELGLPLGTRRDALVAGWLAKAIEQRALLPDSALEELALRQAEVELSGWFAFVLGTESVGDQPPLRVGRAAFLICRGAERWADSVLVYENLPAALIETMRGAVPPVTPPTEPGVMAEQVLESGSLRDLLRVFQRADRRAGVGGTATAAP